MINSHFITTDLVAVLVLIKLKIETNRTDGAYMSLAKVSPQPPLMMPFRRAVNARLMCLNSLTYSCEQCLTLDILLFPFEQSRK